MAIVCASQRRCTLPVAATASEHNVNPMIDIHAGHCGYKPRLVKKLSAHTATDKTKNACDDSVFVFLFAFEVCE